MTEQNFNKLFNAIIPMTNYRGVLVSKVKEGYKVFQTNSVIATNKKEVDAVIDNACKAISNAEQKTYKHGWDE